MLVLHSFQGGVNAMHDSLRRLDLNLLIVFDALYRHRSVVGAASELALSPSACSHALSRLRTALMDELFIRADSGMQPTVMADEVSIGISHALQILAENLGSASGFDPQTASDTIVFAATDFTAYALLPPLIARLEREAPKLKTKVVYSTQRDPWRDLGEGKVHFVLGVSDEYTAHYEGIEELTCFSDDYVVVSRRGHPRIQSELTLAQYLAERHVVVMPWTDTGSVITNSLNKQSVQREVAVELPSMMAAPFIVANSDLLITLPRRAAVQLQSAAALEIYQAPFSTPGYTLKVFFHVRNGNKPANKWLRKQMLLALAESK
ncbi:LysR family transcriptional regulator [Pseudomonas sp. RAC1]|uniref:LysR family transcriptional regulator n=1 Tax=Pseudomonas sp. RAC1 TaxID=3064900 RepID=UPI0027262CEE|nr:LysR family transcriptional regulator [Pseudomonas sp. RAC1]MDV9033036.1 LysR family transcriptional regulator [Pseudomonas sp. RAC1]